jgi:ribulose-5-phosphate 4-epimerase/fuculose-1-phosphate aldolase
VVKVASDRGRRTVYAEGRAIPSRESVLHCKLYRLKAEANAIFHLHDALALKRADDLNIPVMAKERPPGSYELAVEASGLLTSPHDISYFVLKNHGVVSLGTSLEEAGSLVERIRARAERFAL